MLLALVVQAQVTAAFDDPVIAAVLGLPIATDFWKATTQGGGDLLLVIRVAVVVVLLVVERRPRTALVYAIAFLAATALTDLVKVTLGRERPPGAELLGVGGFSFPSGHALNSMVTYGLIALLVWRSGLPERVGRLIAAGLVAVPLVVGLSRVALGVHYPSDVLAGWLAGLVIVAVVCLVTDPDPDLDRHRRAS